MKRFWKLVVGVVTIHETVRAAPADTDESPRTFTV